MSARMRRHARTLGLAAALFAFWLALSGMFTPFLVLSGAGASILVAALAARMEGAEERHALRFMAFAVAYWPWLIAEILKSGWEVLRIVLHPRLPASPTLARFRPSQRTAIGLATHANSITLTPGTLTVEAREGEFVVHALTKSAAAGLAGSEMDRRVAWLEGRR